MAKNKIGLEFDGWEDYMSRLDKIGGRSAVKRGTEAALKSSKQYVNPLIKKGVSNSNLPAGGKFSAIPHVRDTINERHNVEWDGLTASIDIGFDIKAPGGLTSIFLIYGTPKMKPAKGLKAAIYGKKTHTQVAEIQQDAIGKVIKRIMEG